MTPKEYKQMMDYLTRSGISKQVNFASDIARPDPKPEVKEIELFNQFNKRNPMAGGGMLVQPGFGGTRQGYAGDKSLKPGQKKFTSIGKEPGIFKISTRASDKIKYTINYTDNEGNRKKFTSSESFKNITEAKKARNKKINFFEKQLNIPEGKLLDETYTTRRKNISLLPKNKKNYITLTELRNLLGVRSEDMRAVGGSKDTVAAKASAKLLDQTKITTKDGANYFFYKKPTDQELNLLKTYIDARPIRKDMFKRIQDLQKDKYTAKIIKDGKLPMNADGVLDEKFLKHVSDKYGTLDKYVHGLVRYTQALDGQTIIGLNDPILSDGKFKTNKKLASNIVNTFLETPRGSSNASQNTIRKAVYKAAMNDITNELGNTETTFENFKNQIRQKINNDFKLKGKGIEIDELIGVSTSFRNKTAPYAVFTQLATTELNQGILKDYQKVVSNYTAQLKDEINKNSKFVNGKWQHSKKAKDIVNNFNTNIIPNLKNVDQLKGTNVSLPELTLGSPTDKTLGGTKGRLNQLENMGLNFRDFYRQEGFGYKMPEGVVTQKEILGDKKTQANLLKKMGSKTGTEGFINLDLFKDVGRGAGAAFKAFPTLAPVAALNLGLGVDPTSAIDRAGIAAEAAFAPGLVQQAAKFSPAVQRVLNLGLSPQLALRAARIASPIGIASLGAEGLYQAGRFTRDRIRELQAMTPEQRQQLRAEQSALAFEGARDGGLIGKKSGPPPESGPDSQGLPGLLKRVKKL